MLSGNSHNLFKRKMITSGFDKLDQSARDFIDSVIGSMKYRYKERCEVRQELIDHFLDAVCDCKTDKERTEVVNKLIQEFGDPKMLGLLARRGKKRCRPMWQKVLFTTLQCLGVCIILLVLYIVWFISGKPKVEINYLQVLNEQVRPAAAEEGQNAEPFYSKAVELYNTEAIDSLNLDDKYKDKSFDIGPRSFSEITWKERTAVEKWVKDNAAVLEQVRQGNDLHFCWRKYDTGDYKSTELIGILLPHLKDYKNLARLILWQGLIYADAGEYDKAFDNVEDAYLFGERIKSRNNTLIEQLVGIAFERMSSKVMCIILDENSDDITAEQLAALNNRYKSLVETSIYNVDYSGEVLCMKDEAQRSFVESRFGPDHLYAKRLAMICDDDYPGLAAIFAFKSLFNHPDKKGTLETIDQFSDYMNAATAITPAANKAQGQSISEKVDELSKGNVFLSAMMPALGRVIEMFYQNKIQTEAVRAIIALHQYNKQNSRYPESLNELVETGLLEQVPLDPFSDKEIMYKKEGGSFKLYSIGSNFVDDGGNPERIEKHQLDFVYWPIEKTKK